MKLKKLKLYEEFVGTPTKNYSYIKARMEELSDLVNDILKSDYSSDAKFEYELIEDELEVTLVLDREHPFHNYHYLTNEVGNSVTLEILFDLDTLLLGTYFGREEDFRVGSIEEGMDIIEKKIYDVLGVSEKKKN